MVVNAGFGVCVLGACWGGGGAPQWVYRSVVYDNPNLYKQPWFVKVESMTTYELNCNNVQHPPNVGHDSVNRQPSQEFPCHAGENPTQP